MKKIKAGTIKRLHVDQHRIRKNIKLPVEEHLPPLTIQTSKGPKKAITINVNGPSQLVYRPHKPLSCGARLWIETKAEVEYE